jgi:hypothetical protein
METFILGCLSACLLFSLIMACVQLIKIEKGLVEIADFVEMRVTRFYKNED